MRYALAVRILLTALALASLLVPAQRQSAPNDPKREDWIQLFNGKSLDGWTPKFAKHDIGENFNDTFRVDNGLLEVRYDKWTKFDGEFGHLFYKDAFSYYRLAADYRFVG